MIKTIKKYLKLHHLKQCAKNVVVFGSVGVGKTSLINKLTGASFETNEGSWSCTREIQVATSLLHSMMFIDFPGMNATRDVLDHVETQISTLKVIPFKAICFVTKGAKRRFDDILREVGQMTELFENHLENVIIVITHSEEYDERTKSELEHVIKEDTCFENIIFTKNSDSYKNILDKFNQLMSKMENQPEFIIKSKVFYQKQINSNTNVKLNKIRDKYAEIFNKALIAHEEIFNKANDTELIRCLYFSIKEQDEIAVNGFRKEIETILGADNINKIVTEQILFQNYIFEPFNNFRDKCSKKLKIQAYNYSGNSGSEFNKYKRCPSCGVIWFRVYGCDSIICGRRSIGKDKFYGNWFRYKFDYNDGILRYEKKTESSQGAYQEIEAIGLTESEIELNKSRDIKIEPKGCGKTFRWNEMIDVTPMIEETLQMIDNSDTYSFIEKSKAIISKIENVELIAYEIDQTNLNQLE